jgi:hypothetical protein
MMRNDTQLRTTVREIIEIQQSIALNGGTVNKEFRWLKILERRLFEKLDIKFSNPILELVFSYPGSQVLDITEPCNVSECARLQYKVMQMYIANSNRWRMILWEKNGKSVNIELKVECVMENLYAITGEFFKD